MHHFFADASNMDRQAGTARITGPDVNHARNVLRMKPGEQVLISDGQGQDYLGQIKELSAEAVWVENLSPVSGRELPAFITLYQGLPKSDKMELIIQKAVELGAGRIVPVSTRNAVVKLDGKKEEAKRKRWQAIAESAAKQSKRSRIPEIGPVMTFQEAAAEAAGTLGFFAYENEKGMSGTARLLERAVPGEKISVFIGPEGGFDEKEAEKAREMGLLPVSLGSRILRTETAGLALLSVLMMRLEILAEMETERTEEADEAGRKQENAGPEAAIVRERTGNGSIFG